MQHKQTDILKDQACFNKFCEKENRVFGCRGSFGCHIACPLRRALDVQYLMNEKGMTMGDAHRCTIREELTNDERREALISLLKDKETVSLKELFKCIGKI
jgi:hypothetical protein